jgi:hypothetical protein
MRHEIPRATEAPLFAFADNIPVVIPVGRELDL